MKIQGAQWLGWSGFGGQTKGNLYRIDFTLGDFVYKDMPIIAKEMDSLNCHMILSATMFEKMIYTVDTINKKLELKTFDNQIIRNLKLSDDSGGISVYLAGTYATEEEYQAQNPNT